MSQRVEKSHTNGFDPYAEVRKLRDTWLDVWSKQAIELVNTETYSQATSRLLSSYLSLTHPYRQLVASIMPQVLGQLNLPSRSEFVSLAQRLTNIEMRLDDMDARLDDLMRAVSSLRPAVEAPEALAAPAARDRLASVSGIGPVYEQRLNQAGISTFAQLAALAPDRLKEIIAPSRLQDLELESWIEQARQLASDGQVAKEER